MGYSRYGWAANQITEEDMSQLYHLKKATKKPITTMVSEAVRLYLSQQVPVQDTSKALIMDREGQVSDSN